MVKQELLKVADVRVELAKLRESGLGDSLNAKKLASIIDSTSDKYR